MINTNSYMNLSIRSDYLSLDLLDSTTHSNTDFIYLGSKLSTDFSKKKEKL